LGPIDNLTDLLEARGLKVGCMDADVLFDACTFLAKNDLTVTCIAVRADMPGDRQRFCLGSRAWALDAKTRRTK